MDKETILLVEDGKEVRKLVRRILEGRGYSVVEATNGLEAIKKCEDENLSPSLLLTDVIMPQMNGNELAVRLKEKNPKLKVMFMSGYTDDIIGNHGVLEPGTHFLQKPVRPKILLSKVEEVLGASPKNE